MAVAATIWTLILFLPVVIGLGLVVPKARGWLRPVAPWSALPALAVSLLPAAPDQVRMPWLLLETRLGLTQETRVFLVFTALLWTAAAMFSRTYLGNDEDRDRFWVFWQFTFAGNLGVIIAQDAATFYFAFALMTFAGYGLIVHDDSPQARRAGRIYIIMAVFGEVMLITGFILLTYQADGLAIETFAENLGTSPYRFAIVALLLGGFGVKAGVIPLHIWLPLAHPVAPTPASAVLSGAMIKAGLLGWLQFISASGVEMPVWGPLFIGVGVGAALAAAVAGVFQKDPKTVLAYSSISQMGIISTGVGVIMLAPASSEPMTIAIAFYALHHGVAKGALFLGVGVAYAYIRSPRTRGLVNLLMVLPAAALVGAPLTSGDAAKNALKAPLGVAPGQWEPWLTWLLFAAAIGTTVLMGRFLYLVRPGAVGGDVHHPFERGLWGPWVALIVLGLAATVFVPWYFHLDEIVPFHLEPGYVWQAIGPILAGLALVWVTNQLRGRGYGRRIPAIPPGDILLPLESAWERVERLSSVYVVLWWRATLVRADRRREAIDMRYRVESWLADAEVTIVRFRIGGVLFLVLLLTLYLLARV